MRKSPFGALLLLMTAVLAEDDKNALSSSDQPLKIVVFHQGQQVVDAVKAVCANSTEAFNQTADTNMSVSCMLPPGTCVRQYLYSIIGVAGVFSQGQLQKMDDCVPGGILYQEQDQEVSLIGDGTDTAPSGSDDDYDNDDKSHPQITTLEGESEFAGSIGGRKLLQQAPAAAGPTESHTVGFGRETLADNRVMLIETTSPNITVLVNAIQGDSYAAPLMQESGAERSDTSALPEVDVNSQTNGEFAGNGFKVQQLPANGGLWNLDRIDQLSPPLNQQYLYGSFDSNGTGEGATIYIVDSGVRTTHQEFTSWDDPARRRAFFGVDVVGNFSEMSEEQDCDGHGTHVASVAAGRTVGVAKEATVVAVRVLDCTGHATISDTIAGLDWVAQHAQGPSVIMMSMGVRAGKWSQILELATRSLIIDYNITVVVAAGNNAGDSCSMAPANVPETISVAASDTPNKFHQTHLGEIDAVYSFSNMGSCVDIFAPGVDIFGACGGEERCRELSDEAYTWGTGTSIAAPHVAGVAAIYLARNPAALPHELKATVLAASTKSAIDPSLLQPGTPNRLLYSNLEVASGGNAIVEAAAGPDRR